MAPSVEKRHEYKIDTYEYAVYIYIYVYVQYMYSVIIWLCIYSTNMLGNHNA